MSKKAKQKKAEQGTYALCITVGILLGFGLGAIANNLIVITVIGALAGIGVAYFINHRKRSSSH